MSYQHKLESWARLSLNAKPRPGGDWADLKAPCHDDAHASGSLRLSDGWFWCQTCGGGMWADELAQSFGLPTPPTKEGAPEPQPDGTRKIEYLYETEDGKKHSKTVKTITQKGKEFKQASWTGDRWDFKMVGVERILYRLPQLATSKGPVLFVEGEKDALAAERLGFSATTIPQGAGKAHKVNDWSPLAGKEVVIIPDNDEAGEEHAIQLLEILKGVALKAKILRLPNLPHKGDLSDWIQQGGNREELTELVAQKLAHATPDRTWIERQYLVSAWTDQQAAQILSTWPIQTWRNGECRATARAIQSLIEENAEIDHSTISQRMREQGSLEHFRAIEKFEDSTHRKIKPGSRGPYDAFKEAVNWDRMRDLVEQLQQELGKGSAAKAMANAHELTGDLLESQSANHHRTLKQVAESICQDVAEGKPQPNKVWIPFFSEIIGLASGGDVLPYCGPPKTGKSFLLRTMREELSRQGIPTLTSQLELSEEQVTDREACSLTSEPTIDQITAKRLLKDRAFDHLEKAYFTTEGNSIATCKAEVWSYLSAHPEIKVWLLDYNERIYGLKDDPNQEAARVAKFCKDTAKRFGVVVVVLLQPNDRYYKEALYGPRVDHVDRGKKMLKDAYALGFMHKPSRFDGESPEDLIEFHILATRGSKTGVSKLRFVPEKARFEPWGSEPIVQTPRAKQKPDGKAFASNDDTFEDHILDEVDIKL